MTFWGVEVKLSLPHTSILLNYILKALFFSGLLHYVANIYRGIVALSQVNIFILALLTSISCWLSASFTN